MSDLMKAAQTALDAWERSRQWPFPNRPDREFDLLRVALTQSEPLAQEIERLRAALRYEENRFSRVGTHGPDCWKWGPSHYECALQRITNA